MTDVAALPPERLEARDGAYSCRLRLRPPVSEIVLSGELDVAVLDWLNPTLRQAIDFGAIDALIVDLTGVDFIDSTVMRWLIHAKRIAGAASVRATVATTPSVVEDRLTIAGLESYLWT